MIEAICTKCGALYYGWVLRYVPEQYCSKCGASLEILDSWIEGANRNDRGAPEVSPQSIDWLPRDEGKS